MDTTVTGIFPDQHLARQAVSHLLSEGFGRDQVRVVDAAARDRHHFIEKRTEVTKRASTLGLVIGPTLGLLAGVLLIGVFEPLPAILGGLAVGVLGGTVLGLLVGRATSTQMQDEIEHQVDNGNVLVSVYTDAASSERARTLLAEDGAVNMVASAVSFQAGVLPVAQPGALQEELPPKG
jgi:phosphohistidine swiveling domain-containing protein